VLLGKIDVEFVQNLTSVSTQGAEQATITIHDNEAKLVIGLEQLVESLQYSAAVYSTAQ
jgi:hypothetical protein